MSLRDNELFRLPKTDCKSFYTIFAENFFYESARGWYCSLDAIETPFQKTEKDHRRIRYLYWIISVLFCQTYSAGFHCGSDFPQETLKYFNRKGIKTEGVEVKRKEIILLERFKYHMDMNSRDTLITDLNVLAEFDPVLPQSYQSPDYVMLGNIDPNLQIKVIEQLRNRPKLIAMDTMNFWMNTTPNELAKALKLTDVLIINDEEARQLSGEYALAKAAKVIMKKGPVSL